MAASLQMPKPTAPLHADLFRHKILCIGDSITQYAGSPGGWATHLGVSYSRRADILNRGYSGYSSRWILSALPTILQSVGLCTSHTTSVHGSTGPALLTTIMLGANDAAGSSLPGLTANSLQHIALPEYTDNMRHILRQCCTVSHVVAVISPPPVSTKQWPDRSSDAVSTYRAACAQLVEEARRDGLSVVFVDYFNAVLSLGSEWETALNDGLHLSDFGNKLLHDSILDALASQGYAALLPDALSIDLPLWRDVNNASVEATADSLSEAALKRLHASPQPSK
jgi:lysophospholipase L1-like esterase